MRLNFLMSQHFPFPMFKSITTESTYAKPHYYIENQLNLREKILQSTLEVSYMCLRIMYLPILWSYLQFHVQSANNTLYWWKYRLFSDVQMPSIVNTNLNSSTWRIVSGKQIELKAFVDGIPEPIIMWFKVWCVKCLITDCTKLATFLPNAHCSDIFFWVRCLRNA